NESGQAINMQAWYGSDLNKLWFKLEGERSDGKMESVRSELLWDKAISAYWGLQTGIRHDFEDGPDLNWAAFGVQGLAPYWFEVQATAYLGESGRTALRLEVEYEILLTQRLILQPDLEINFYGKDDPARDIGSGLSDVEFGLRLRYEITRKFAPYVGVVWSKKYGQTATYAQAANEDVQDTQLVAGVRLWF
ncbi:copper resistance protein B, partial [Dokdonella sp.]|uniref:copper resistance protein B n=1 Tax=Dokdonella sp. TaxID=2291710 RepID=UPI003C486B82